MDFIKTSSENLYLSIHTIGYETKGESTVISFYSKSPECRMHYVCVIDSYELEGENITDKVLKDIFKDYPRNRKKIDLLCWTHPDEDHTVGLDQLIDQYIDINTKISSPLYALFHPQNECSKVVAEKIHSLSKGRNINKRQPLVPMSEDGEIDKRGIELANKLKIPVKFTHVGPYANLYANALNNYEPNKLSPMILLDINGFNLIFGGDCHNYTIRRGENMIPKSVSFVKIPHHGSKSSDFLADALESNESEIISCTSKFNKILPDSEVLNKYIRLSKAISITSNEIPNSENYKFVTEGLSFKNVNMTKDLYGIIHYEICLSNLEKNTSGVRKIMPTTVKHFGKASKVAQIV
ncbi:MAG: hypothetical protein JEZ08_13250 [Clostridiales bacterium]|nr:hypothetical protein [Clostridiales bacterium]